MVYHWDGKEQECFRLYVEERRSLDDVMEYWEQRGFTPSKRAFQTQFKRWDFPSKQSPAHKNPALIARVRELWEQNMMQRDMLDTLQAEGFHINDRELMRLRLRFKWLLRESVGRGVKRKLDNHGAKGTGPTKARVKVVPGNGLIDQLTNAILADEASSEAEQSAEEQEIAQQTEPIELPRPIERQPESVPLDPAETLRRQLRQEQLQIESDEKWRTRKRRRRTRGWAGLPADAPGEPPRFPSETTLDESKAYLGLDNKLYRALRERFQAICEEQGVVKKTIAGPEKWAQLLQQLIRENAHLSSVFQQEPELLQQHDALWRPKNYKALSLDVICMDVTKRLRTMDTRMGIPEAKNILGLNPEQTRHVRAAFSEKLKADHFTNKLEAGDQHWNELKQVWVQDSELLSQVLVQGEADPKYAEKVKAIEVLARDVMKRLRNEKTAKDPSRRKQTHQGPGPGPAPPTVVPHASSSHLKTRANAPRSTTMAQQTTHVPLSVSTSPDLQIDPSLLLAASDASVIPAPSPSISHPHPQQPHHHHHHQQTYNQQYNHYTSSTSQYFPQVPNNPTPTPLPIYFRLHSHSTTSLPNKTVWLSILSTPSVPEIRNLAMREHPGTIVMRVEGLVVHKMHGQPDREVMIGIDDEDELSAYLQHVGSGKVTFVVLLALAGGGNGYV